jgi:hypothetical protein
MIREMNESAKQALVVADILDYTREDQTEEGLEPSNTEIVPERILNGSLTMAPRAMFSRSSRSNPRASVSVSPFKPEQYGALHSQAGENRSRLNWDEKEIYLIGVEYRKLEERHNGNLNGVQVCKDILTALQRNAEAIPYFPWHHLCDVKRLRVGVDTYKKTPENYLEDSLL